jgi:hypothetical protein
VPSCRSESCRTSAITPTIRRRNERRNRAAEISSAMTVWSNDVRTRSGCVLGILGIVPAVDERSISGEDRIDRPSVGNPR